MTYKKMISIIVSEIQENTQRRVSGIILVEGFKKSFNTD